MDHSLEIRSPFCKGGLINNETLIKHLELICFEHVVTFRIFDSRLAERREHGADWSELEPSEVDSFDGRWFCRDCPCSIFFNQSFQCLIFRSWTSLLINWSIVVIGSDVSSEIIFLSSICICTGSQSKISSPMHHVHRIGVIVSH